MCRRSIDQEHSGLRSFCMRHFVSGLVSIRLNRPEELQNLRWNQLCWSVSFWCVDPDPKMMRYQSLGLRRWHETKCYRVEGRRCLLAYLLAVFPPNNIPSYSWGLWWAFQFKFHLMGRATEDSAIFLAPNLPELTEKLDPAVECVHVWFC